MQKFCLHRSPSSHTFSPPSPPSPISPPPPPQAAAAWTCRQSTRHPPTWTSHLSTKGAKTITRTKHNSRAAKRCHLALGPLLLPRQWLPLRRNGFRVGRKEETAIRGSYFPPRWWV